MDETIEPPERNYLVRLGPLTFYWIWINEGSEHQHRCWILNWHTPRMLVHLADWRWWRPLALFPRAMLASRKLTRKA